jgi:hypothetical protein
MRNFITCTHPQIISQIKSRRMRWERHVARMGEDIKVYNFLVVKPEGNRQLGRPGRRWEEGFRMDLGKIGWELEWIHLAQDRARWLVAVNTMIKLGVLGPRR